jgi:hypothetical protein
MLTCCRKRKVKHIAPDNPPGKNIYRDNQGTRTLAQL